MPSSLSILRVADALHIKYSSTGSFRRCRCFMHEDRHPSMWFKLSNNTWSCPVCDKGGGPLSLVCEHEGLTPAEAHQWLERQFGTAAPNTSRPAPPRPATRPATPQPPQQPSALPSPLVERCQRTSTTFCQSLVGTGILTKTQMQRAADLYRLGATRDGGVIFWYMDERQRLTEGKIMWYGTDCHRDHQRHPVTVSSRLKRQGRLPADWQATPCFFGQHLLRQTAVGKSPTIAIVESEKTAVICSQLLPTLQDCPVLWMACGGLSRLRPDLFLPLRGLKVAAFPDTDPKGDAHRLWTNACREAARLMHHPVYVSTLLEQHASEEQKRRKIDIADFLLEQC